MKLNRGLLVVFSGLVGAIAAYACFYLVASATPRALLRGSHPELAWLKHEFNLGDAEFAKISQLHASYLPQCAERCRRIEELNRSLDSLLAGASQLTPEMERLLSERALIRVACQQEMLKHFFAVSRTMPPQQGQRYIAWVREHTCLREEVMNHGAASHGKSVGTASGH